ncbi:MAG: hypothetical protein PHD71_08955 [Methanospirillum sp.]|nr:hypothetical protein [Methanospirillum sp.]
MITRYRTEVLRAVQAAIRPEDSLISRQRIEEEIEEHPLSYPGLSERSRTGRRRIISLAMSRMYPYWSKTGGAKPSSYVWKVRDEQGDDNKKGDRP